MSDQIQKRIQAIGLMPVVAKVAVEDSELLAKALMEGGIPNAEITFRMEGADEVIARMRKAYPDMLVGAGTVTSVELAEKALKAGAQFIVSPGLNPTVVKFCQDQGIDIIPGVATPSEVEQAMGMGLRTLKFFPAEQNGGLPAIKAICGPYKGVGFMPTGGVNLNNLADYLAFDRIVACGGTYMLGKYAETKQWAEITALCRKSVQVMLGLKLVHVGLNAPDAAGAQDAASQLSQLLLNLILNGFHAMPKGGTLTISTQAQEETVQITVNDTGTGIAPEVISRIFEPFFTTKEQGKGTGLGLAIAAQVVEDHKGEIDVSSRLGVGTTFVVTIPRKQREEPESMENL